MRLSAIYGAAILLHWPLIANATSAPTETVLLSFRLPAYSAPAAGPLLGAGGVLYGTTSALGQKAPGALGGVYSLSPPTGNQKNWIFSGLHVFLGTNQGDGERPGTGVIEDAAGNLYGTTGSGGSNDAGVVYELHAQGGGSWPETILYTFGFPLDQNSSQPNALLLTANGVLYGTTLSSFVGGCNCGTAFALQPPTKRNPSWAYKSLYVFKGGTDADTPIAGLVKAPNGSLYGVSFYGGNGGCGSGGNPGRGCGTIFRLMPPAKGQTVWTESVIYAFTGGADGATPEGTMIVNKSGALYGTTTFGGTGYGVVFELAPPANGSTTWTETTIHTFVGSDGFNPTDGLTFGPGGSLIGVTSGGDQGGVVFELTPPPQGQSGWSNTILHTFSGEPDGAGPVPRVVRSPSGSLFGATKIGGTSNLGTVYEIKP